MDDVALSFVTIYSRIFRDVIHFFSYVLDGQLELDTLREEKNVLQQQLKSLQQPLLEKTESMENTISELNEKLKRKQTSLTQLQSEKECMYNMHLKTIKELENSKDQEIDQLKGLVQQLQAQFHNSLQVYC